MSRPEVTFKHAFLTNYCLMRVAEELKAFFGVSLTLLFTFSHGVAVVALLMHDVQDGVVDWDLVEGIELMGFLVEGADQGGFVPD